MKIRPGKPYMKLYKIRRYTKKFLLVIHLELTWKFQFISPREVILLFRCHNILNLWCPKNQANILTTSWNEVNILFFFLRIIYFSLEVFIGSPFWFHHLMFVEQRHVAKLQSYHSCKDLKLKVKCRWKINIPIPLELLHNSQNWVNWYSSSQTRLYWHNMNTNNFSIKINEWSTRNSLNQKPIEKLGISI